MNIKQLLGAQAHWTINKELAKTIGIYPTVLLQHLIDLDDSFFKDIQGGFYQQQDRLVNDLPMSESQLRKATTELINLGLITATRKGVPPKYFYSIQYSNLSNLLDVTFKGSVFKHLETEQERLRIKGSIEDKELNNNPDDERLVKIKNLFWKKLVPAYPTNRIGNRQHAEKKWLTLEDKEMVLAIKNLDRYLTITGPYVKQLQNYLVERCFTEEWLKAEEKTKTKKEDKTNTKTFKGNYDSIN